METNQRVVVTKRMLREGLLRLLETKELDKISITELCRESGVNRSTFYRYYAFPKDILTEMQNLFNEEIYNSFQRSITAYDVERLFAYLLENREIVKIFLLYTSELEWLDLFNHFYQRFSVKKSLKAFQDLDEDSSRLLFSYIAGGTYFIVYQWIIEDIPKSPKEMTDIILNVMNKEKSF
jgi:AcrR family transcriptional regulator